MVAAELSLIPGADVKTAGVSHRPPPPPPPLPGQPGSGGSRAIPPPSQMPTGYTVPAPSGAVPKARAPPSLPAAPAGRPGSAPSGNSQRVVVSSGVRR